MSGQRGEGPPTSGGPSSGRAARPGWGRVLLVVLVRPLLWPTAVVQAARLVPRGWWRRRPFLPVPPRGYVRFRTLTAAGDAGRAAPDPAEVLTWLRWCRDWPAAAR